MAALNFCQMQARVGDRELVETAPTDPSPAPGTSCSLRYEPGRTVAHFQVSRRQPRPFWQVSESPLSVSERSRSRNISKARRSLRRNFLPSLSLPSSSPSIPSVL